ncbi:MAG TPA: hypothetical protein VK763_03215 [Terriglobales bacterium]|nr:hypothetical protein [Terriglobales bacterium]
MNCPGTLLANHVTLAAGDQNGASHLQLIRKIEAGAEFDLDICAADVTLTGSDNNMLRVTVDLESPSQQHTAADYLQKLDITPSHVKLQLHLMHALHAKVTIELPAATPELTLNLGRGDLTLVADTVGGERKINVGYGHVNFQGNADAYESMNVNIGLGSLHDNRKDGQNHHFIVARSFEGTGKGSIEMNVGMGGVDLNPGRNKPI